MRERAFGVDHRRSCRLPSSARRRDDNVQLCEEAGGTAWCRLRRETNASSSLVTTASARRAGRQSIHTPPGGISSLSRGSTGKVWSVVLAPPEPSSRFRPGACLLRDSLLSANLRIISDHPSPPSPPLQIRPPPAPPRRRHHLLSEPGDRFASQVFPPHRHEGSRPTEQRLAHGRPLVGSARAQQTRPTAQSCSLQPSRLAPAAPLPLPFLLPRCRHCR